MRYIDITGNKYGELTVLEFAKREKGKIFWKCICSCGNETVVVKSNLMNGHTKRCRKRSNHSKHGMSDTRIYNIWRNLKNRCSCPSNTYYKNYGGKGITYCEEWAKFENFYKWAIENGYSDDLTIDRIDSKGNYEPSNCRWATKKEQANNTSRNLVIEINGVTKNLSQWAEAYGINQNAMHSRYRKGIRGDELLKPIDQRYSRRNIRGIMNE